MNLPPAARVTNNSSGARTRLIVTLYYRDFSFDVTSNRSTGTELIWCTTAMYSCYVLVTILALEVVPDSAASSVLELSLSEVF